MSIYRISSGTKRVALILKALSVLFIWLVVIGGILFFSYFIYLQRTIPDPEIIVTRRIGESTKIYSSEGETLLYDIHGEEKRTIIPWEDIPDYAKFSTLAAEDSNFYSHKGLDIKGIVRAFLRNLAKVEISQGGSTITQQLVKKALLGDQRTLSRKLREAVLAIEIERRFTKDEILWMYLNQIPYGSNLYGIESASKAFFAKPAKELTINESAVLASLIQAPTYYSPFGNHVEDLILRKNWVLDRMNDLGFITEEEKIRAKDSELTFNSNITEISAPHFVIMVKEYLVSKYGEDTVQNGGLKVTTTLNPELQTIAEEVVAKYGEINSEKYKANNAALVAINPKDGSLLALVGSKNYFDIENEGNFNVATAKRQPGSAFKPFAYAQAINKGFTDSTVVFDLKTEFNPECAPDTNETKDKYGLDCYAPRNYTGRFSGPVTLRQALGQSLNIPAVKVLYLAGIGETIDLAESMGITTLQDRSRLGLSLVLGGAEVKLTDITSAYGIFSTDGIKNPWFFIKKVELPDGTVLEENKLNPSRVIPSTTTRLITNMLADNNARASLFGFSNSLYFPGIDVAAKTGTTQENKDGWVVGYTTSIVAGVWTGNNKNTSMTQAGAGISAAGPMWHEFMARAFSLFPPSSFLPPDPVFIDRIMLNGQYAKKEEETGPEIHNILYYVNKNNPLGSSPVNPDQDPQYNNWEWSVKNTYGP